MYCQEDSSLLQSPKYEWKASQLPHLSEVKLSKVKLFYNCELKIDLPQLYELFLIHFSEIMLDLHVVLNIGCLAHMYILLVNDLNMSVYLMVIYLHDDHDQDKA